MRFMVIDRGGTLELPPSEAESLFRRSADWVKDKMDKGKIEVGYAMSGQMSSVMIYNVDSNEELDDLLQEYPLSNYSIFEVYPLSDAIHSFETAGRMFGERRSMAA